MEQSPAPPGSYVEIGLELLDEGKFIRRVNQQLRKAIQELIDYEKETGDRTGSAGVTISVKMGRVKKTEGVFQVDTSIKTAVPSPRNGTVVLERAGRLLCQPVGTNDDPQQQLFYDGAGRIIGGQELIDSHTGEVTTVAGRIAPSVSVAHG